MNRLCFTDGQKEKMLSAAHRIADWYIRNQFPFRGDNPGAGSFYSAVRRGKMENPCAPGWCVAFASMGMLSAARAFQDEKYLDAAGAMLNHLKTLQIFDPFNREHYGAFRETFAWTRWCYVRDALSIAWSFLEYYRFSGVQEYLDRAVLWAEWFMRHGMDESGWPKWGVQFDSFLPGMEPPQMCNDIHGCFHGGSLNFFYQLAKETGDRRWTGSFFEYIADYFCSTIQQENGFFCSVEKASGKVPPQDPQNKLHRGNDDLGTLGLLCAYKVDRRTSRLDSIRKFLTAVFANQQPDGGFENRCAAIPVILNILHESGAVMDFSVEQSNIDRALDALLARQFSDECESAFFGGLNELDDGNLHVRSMGYSLLVFLKFCGKDDRFLTV